jgi:4,5-DOPA dioxygenase extradiol
MKSPMPVIFFGHGNPMNALQSNSWTEGWTALGAAIPRPRAVLVVSAHWFIRGIAVTAMAAPRTIHDFGGFPPELYRVKYPAPGDPQLATRVKDLLAPAAVALDNGWGLDHGSWSILVHTFPKADIPVVQLSLDGTQPPAFHHELGKRLAPLRDEGILVMGSGNLVHNLGAYSWWREAQPLDWAIRFDQKTRELLLTGDSSPLIHYEALGRDAKLAIPTPEHYLPLLYVIALRREGEPVTFPVEGIDGGSISMLTVRIG